MLRYINSVGAEVKDPITLIIRVGGGEHHGSEKENCSLLTLLLGTPEVT